MGGRKSAQTGPQKPASRATTAKQKPTGFTDEERAAMKERARELKRADGTDGDTEVLAKIAEMHQGHRARSLAEEKAVS